MGEPLYCHGKILSRRVGGGAYIAVPSVEDAIACFREEIAARLAGEPDFMKAIEFLRGKNVACWCGLDRPCHGDIWLEAANRPRPMNKP